MVNVLILLTGSVASIKIGLLLDEIHKVFTPSSSSSIPSIEIRIAATSHALHFIQRAQLSTSAIPTDILTDEHEWSSWNSVQDDVLHISLRRWADCVLLVPLDANTLAKLANGIADNLVTCIMRAWELNGTKPVLVCPAMNTAMWVHPVTQEHLRTLRRWYSSSSTRETEKKKFSPLEAKQESVEKEQNGSESSSLHEGLESEYLFQIIDPVEKKLACGDVGVGGMASVQTIAFALKQTVQRIEIEKTQKKQKE